MKRRTWIGLGTLAFISSATLLAACGADDGSQFDPPGGFDGSSGTTTSGGTGSGGSWGESAATTGTSGTSGASTGSGVAPVGGDDAGAPDAAPQTCEGLDQESPVILYLSADDSNSMASPVEAREMLNSGDIPWNVRTYEFLNYYRIHYQAAPAGTLSLFPALEAAAQPGEMNLQIGVRSFDAPKARRPITVTFVLDTSGSMSGTPIARERAAVKAIAKSLAAGDIVNMVTWSTSNAVIMNGYEVTGPSDALVIEAANALSASGGTDLHGGLVAGYDLAQQNYGDKRMNRLVLISDGGANVGITDEDLIAQHSADADKEGIYLVGVGTGPVFGYNDILMDTVTDRGRGAYVYLDSEEEADAVFFDRFDETMEVAARAVQVELTMPWYFQMFKFYGEEYSTDPKEVQPQHLAPSDAMVFDQVIKACDPSVVNTGDTITVTARWQEPLTYLNQETTLQMTVGELLSGDKGELHKGMAIVAYAEALKTGMQADLAAAFEAVQAANVGGTDVELNEIATLIQKHPAF